NTHEEYALARTERKSGRGYKGFAVHTSPDVTLEDDLRRRDVTINAMAKAEDGALIDPYGGKRDLEQGILRHVSEAFAEDPVRILRVARFAARFGFRVAPETMALMQKMVEGGETDYLVPERVWQEFAKGLMEREPERMFELLKRADAFRRPGRFAELLEVARRDVPLVDTTRLERAYTAAAAVDAGAVAAAAPTPADIPRLIDERRIEAITRAL